MAKPLFQDVIPPDKRSIKRVPVPDRTIRSRHIRVADDEADEESVRPTRTSATQSKIPSRGSASTSSRTSRASVSAPIQSEPSYSPTSNRVQEPPAQRIPFYEERDPYRRRFPWKSAILFVCAIVIIVGTYLTLSHYATATITITSKTEAVTVNNQFTGILMASSSPAGAPAPALLAGQIPYQVISVVKDGSMAVASTGQTSVQTKATGQITIFNNYSTTAQKLIAGTRFATTAGLIYRINAAVSVPGKKGTTPGSITASVTADQAGDQYNIGLSDFVVPGLSGTAAYTNIYARSKTTMTGGFSGIQPQIDPATLAAAQATIDAELEGSLLAQAREEILPTEILLPNAYVVSYQHLSSEAASSSQATIHEEGTIYAFAVDATSLADAFAQNAATSTANNSTTWQITDAGNLSIAVGTGSTTPSSFWNSSSIPFSVSGTTNLVAVIDQEKIKENLVGKPKSDFDPILQGFPEVATASMTFEPFWQHTFPLNPENITIKLSQ